MGKRDEKPIIRILLLGPPRVGKNCLESRFTTQTYPPLYDPTLTLTSRRYYTLSSHTHGSEQPKPSTLPLETREGSTGTPKRRSGSASSTVSHPPSETRSPTPPTSTHPPKLSLQTSPTPNSNQRSAAHLPTPLTPTSHPLATEDTYLVELANYPALQHAKTRASVLARRDYDAVILVYDVGSRASFDAMAALHGEIPLSASPRSRRSVRRTRSGIFSGGGAGGGGSPVEGNPHNHSPGGWQGGTGETVVALVGNKCDFDEEDDAYPEKVGGDADKEAAAVEERSLVHPLFRPRSDDVPLSPRSARSMPVGGDSYRPVSGELRRARSVVSEGGAGQRVSVFSVARRGSLNLVPEEERNVNTDTDEVRPATPPRETGVPVAVGPESAAIQKWLEMDSDEPGSPGVGYGFAQQERRIRKQRQREVSRFEGEMLARSLLVNVPFCETSARTGENVEELFDVVVREVLREMGVDVGRARLADRGQEKETPTPALTRKRSVLKKERRAEENRDVIARESVVSEHPPVLTLSGLDEDVAERPRDIAPDGPMEIDAAEPASTSQKRRRESGLGSFFKKVFNRKSAVMVPHVAA